MYINGAAADAIKLFEIPSRPMANSVLVAHKLQEKFFPIDYIQQWMGERHSPSTLTLWDMDLMNVLMKSPTAFHAFKELMVEPIWRALFTEETFDRLKQAYAARETVKNVFVREWVISTGIRIKAEVGNILRFRKGDAILTGKVMIVNKGLASAFVEIDKEKREGVWVNCEDIIKVFPTSNYTPPDNNPAGTPVAMAA